MDTYYMIYFLSGLFLHMLYPTYESCEIYNIYIRMSITILYLFIVCQENFFFIYHFSFYIMIYNMEVKNFKLILNNEAFVSVYLLM